eukprot:TRINITY_DN3798_c0_g1_i3.p1 TRINITY_DN3798_c0_g1~~TRINITY_DN3798_c0_g1_i3.p1  ORF type:complete len:1471 (+),score=504.85 TRINITY_DN3798_c0_g1_i3:328-4740(+)
MGDPNQFYSSSPSAPPLEYFPPSEQGAPPPYVESVQALPPGWELGYTERGRVYFINHNDFSTTFIDPRKSQPISSPRQQPAYTYPHSPQHGYGSPNTSMFTSPTSSMQSSPHSGYGSPIVSPQSPARAYSENHLHRQLYPDQPPRHLQEMFMVPATSPPQTPTKSEGAPQFTTPVAISARSQSQTDLSSPPTPVRAETLPVEPSKSSAKQKKVYKDHQLAQLKAAKAEMEKAHKQNQVQDRKAAEAKQKVVVSKQQAQSTKLTKQMQEELKQAQKKLETAQLNDDRHFRSQYAHDKKMEKAKEPKYLPSKELHLKLVSCQFKGRVLKFKSKQTREMQEMQLYQQRQTQRTTHHNNFSQAREISEFILEGMHQEHSNELRFQATVNGLGLQITQRIHALDRDEVESQAKAKHEELVQKLGAEGKQRTKEFKAQEKIRMKEQEKDVKVQVKNNKLLSKKALTQQNTSLNEQLFADFLQRLADEKQVAEKEMFSKQNAYFEKVKSGQHRFEQEKLNQYAKALMALHFSQSDAVHQYLQNSYKVSRKQLSEQHQDQFLLLTQHYQQLQNLAQSHWNEQLKLLNSNYDKMIILFQKDIQKEKEASSKLQQRTARKMSMSLRNSESNSPSLRKSSMNIPTPEELSAMEASRSQRILGETRWKHDLDLFLLAQKNKLEAEFNDLKRELIHKRQTDELSLLKSQAEEESELEEYYYQTFLKELTDRHDGARRIAEVYAHLLDEPLAVPPDRATNKLTKHHQMHVRKKDELYAKKLEQFSAQHAQESQEFERNYRMLLNGHEKTEADLALLQNRESKELEDRFDQNSKDLHSLDKPRYEDFKRTTEYVGSRTSSDDLKRTTDYVAPKPLEKIDSEELKKTTEYVYRNEHPAITSVDSDASASSHHTNVTQSTSDQSTSGQSTTRESHYASFSVKELAVSPSSDSDAPPPYARAPVIIETPPVQIDTQNSSSESSEEDLAPPEYRPPADVIIKEAETIRKPLDRSALLNYSLLKVSGSGRVEVDSGETFALPPEESQEKPKVSESEAVAEPMEGAAEPESRPTRNLTSSGDQSGPGSIPRLPVDVESSAEIPNDNRADRSESTSSEGSSAMSLSDEPPLYRHRKNSTEAPNPKLNLRAVALFSYTSKKNAQLSFSSGDLIIVNEQKKSGWWTGSLYQDVVKAEQQGTQVPVGKFPGNFCRILQEGEEYKPLSKSHHEEDEEGHTQMEEDTKRPLEADTKREEDRDTQIHMISSLDKMDLALRDSDESDDSFLKIQEIPIPPEKREENHREKSPGIVITASADAEPKDVETPKVAASDDGLKPPAPLRKFAAMYDYTATADNQLSFKEGDIITVQKKRKSGWWIGLLNGKVGRFPINFCKPIDPNDSYRQATQEKQSTGLPKMKSVPSSDSLVSDEARQEQELPPSYTNALKILQEYSNNEAEDDMFKIDEDEQDLADDNDAPPSYSFKRIEERESYDLAE